MLDFFRILILLSCVWVLIDAKRIGVTKGQIDGFWNIGPWGWFFGCIFLWIVCFPMYLSKRSLYIRINSRAKYVPKSKGAGQCPTCLKQYTGDPSFCPNCGYNLKGTITTTAKVGKLQFYMGQASLDTCPCVLTCRLPSRSLVTRSKHRSVLVLLTKPPPTGKLGILSFESNINSLIAGAFQPRIFPSKQ